MSDSDNVIAYSSKASGDGEIYLSDIEGKSKIKITDRPGNDGYVAWSPDGKRIASYGYYDGRKTWSIHTMNTDGTNRKRLTHAKNNWDNSPTWSPDGSKIAFARAYTDSAGVRQKDIWIMNADGSEQTQIKPLVGGGPYFTTNDRLVFHSGIEKNQISIANIDGSNLIQLTNNDAENWHPEVSSDGRKIAFMSDRDGNHEIYVMNIDGSDQTRLTFNEVDDWYPSWSPDGSQLIFSSSKDEERQIYKMNKDGSSIEPIISGGSQAAWLKITQEKTESPFNFPKLEGPYMGQKPPGIVAEPFAPGIISKEGWEIEGVFAPGMNEFYFTTSHKEPFSPTVIGFRQENNVWKKYTEFKRRGEITFSPDGKRMHMSKGYKDRVGDGWSERKSLGPMFDREDWGIMRLTASAMGTYVFDDYKNGDVIRISKLKDGTRQAPEKMGPIVNTGEWTAHPFIAPDESYLIWDSEREGGYGDSDLYISFRQKDGSWGPAINMGENVNSDKWDAYASVTSDGKYILFNRTINSESSNTDIYWVDAEIIETLRSKQ
jgi:Tol biopolymer transport system component